MAARSSVIDGLTTSWLAQRLGVEPRRLEVMRRSGELSAIPQPASQTYVFPSWQFDHDFKPLPGVEQVVRAARARGFTDEELSALMQSRSGLVQGRRLADLLREGNVEHVLEGIRAARIRS